MKPTEYDILLAGEQRLLEAIQQLEEEYNFHLAAMNAELDRVREALTKCGMSVVHVSHNIDRKFNSNE
jgi:precorrin-3B methylase